MRVFLTRTPEGGFPEKGLKELGPFPLGDIAGFYYAKGNKIVNLSRGDKIIFDGVITNYAGHEEEYLKWFFHTGSIEDLVLDSQEWDGAWSIIYIHSNGRIYCFTDPLGKKQLYYNPQGRISSSITALALGSQPDELYRSEVAKWGYNTDDRTPWEKVKRIMPNQLYSFDKTGELLRIKRPHFDFRWSASPLSPRGFKDMVHNRVGEYLKGIEAKSVGVLLSGGIDSSIIATELLKFKDRGFALNFYTINNQEDAPFVELFAKIHGLKVTTLSYDMSKIDLRKALTINETPVDLGSMIPNQIMFSQVPEQVIFTGDGPDELFGGYRRIDDYDSQKSDVFQELSFYHLPRLERAADHFGKDLRCPWLSYDIIRYALSLPYEDRKHKSILKEAYKDEIPAEIIQRPKLPLKNDEIRTDPFGYRCKLINTFYDTISMTI